MALKEDALHRGDPSVSDPFPSRPAGRKIPDPPRPTGSFKKLLTFKNADESPMLDFPSERKVTARSAWIAGAIVSAVALVVGVFLLVPKWRTAAIPKSGQLAVSSQPPGADVFVDGQYRDVTPLTFGLPTGTHSLR